MTHDEPTPIFSSVADLKAYMLATGLLKTEAVADAVLRFAPQVVNLEDSDAVTQPLDARIFTHATGGKVCANLTEKESAKCLVH